MRRHLPLLRSVLVGAAALGASAIVLVDVREHYPLEHWLFFRYLAYWSLSAVFSLACATLGFGISRAVLGRVLPIREQLTVSLAVGLLGYFLITFTAGLLGLFGPLFAFSLPVMMVAAGARPTLRYARRLRRHVRAARARRRAPAERAWVESIALALGLLAICLIYFSILSPKNASFDARWYHLPLAEHYADAGAITRFPEGWVMGAFPHLASVVYTWAFQMPFTTFDKVALSAHLELAIFLWTLFGVPALVRRMLPRDWRPRPRAAQSWAAVFLFPGIFLYDSSLNLGADHVAAMWAVPIYLLLLRAWPALRARESVLLGAALSGALLTKYTGILSFAFPVLAIALRAAWLGVRRLRGRGPAGFVGIAAIVVTGLVLTSPHWLKNWVWYGDPLFPTFHSKLSLRPWTPAADVPFHYDVQVPWHATRDLEGLVETLRVMVTFAFEHHDWGVHGRAPVFGFLFTVTLLCLPFLGFAKRLWGLYLAGHLGVALWCTINWQDRYLQALVPWMAAAVAATAIRMWRMGRAARLGAVLLIGLQIIWGSDVYFFTTHRVIESPVIASVQLLNAARQGKFEERLRVFGENDLVEDALPVGAVPLVHESRQTFGIGRRRVHDRPGTQGLLYYERHASTRAIYDQLAALGVTHVVFGRPEGVGTIASELLFRTFVRTLSDSYVRAGSLTIARMPEAPPPDVPFGRNVAFLGCAGSYPRGLYRLEDLTISPFDPAPRWPTPERAFPSGIELRELLSLADFAVVGCAPRIEAAELGAFMRVGPYRDHKLFVRRAPR